MGENGLEWGRLWDESVFTCAALLGASNTVTTALQITAMLLAAAITYYVFRCRHPAEFRLATVLSATVVAAPHVSPYDMIPPALAASTLGWLILEEKSRPLHMIVPVTAWLLPLFNPPRVMPIGLLTPLLIFGLIAILIARSYRAIAPDNRDKPSSSNFGSCAKQIRT